MVSPSASLPRWLSTNKRARRHIPCTYPINSKITANELPGYPISISTANSTPRDKITDVPMVASTSQSPAAARLWPTTSTPNPNSRMTLDVDSWYSARKNFVSSSFNVVPSLTAENTVSTVSSMPWVTISRTKYPALSESKTTTPLPKPTLVLRSSRYQPVMTSVISVNRTHSASSTSEILTSSTNSASYTPMVAISSSTPTLMFSSSANHTAITSSTVHLTVDASTCSANRTLSSLAVEASSSSNSSFTSRFNWKKTVPAFATVSTLSSKSPVFSAVEAPANSVKSSPSSSTVPVTSSSPTSRYNWKKTVSAFTSVPASSSKLSANSNAKPTPPSSTLEVSSLSSTSLCYWNHTVPTVFATGSACSNKAPVKSLTWLSFNANTTTMRTSISSPYANVAISTSESTGEKKMAVITVVTYYGQKRTPSSVKQITLIPSVVPSISSVNSSASGITTRPVPYGPYQATTTELYMGSGEKTFVTTYYAPKPAYRNVKPSMFISPVAPTVSLASSSAPRIRITPTPYQATSSGEKTVVMTNVTTSYALKPAYSNVKLATFILPEVSSASPLSPTSNKTAGTSITPTYSTVKPLKLRSPFRSSVRPVASSVPYTPTTSTFYLSEITETHITTITIPVTVKISTSRPNRTLTHTFINPKTFARNGTLRSAWELVTSTRTQPGPMQTVGMTIGSKRSVSTWMKTVVRLVTLTTVLWTSHAEIGASVPSTSIELLMSASPVETLSASALAGTSTSASASATYKLKETISKSVRTIRFPEPTMRLPFVYTSLKRSTTPTALVDNPEPQPSTPISPTCHVYRWLRFR
jgi:hypothetical protein